MTPRDRQALERIGECLDAIDRYVGRVGEEWPFDGMAVDALAKRIEEIGEVAKRLSSEAIASMPGVDWRSLKGMREVMAHDYEDVDVEILVEVVGDHLPGLRAAVTATLAG